MVRKQWFVGTALLVATACAPAGSANKGGMDSASMQAGKAAVDSVRAKYQAAFKAGDAAAIAALYTSDPISMGNMQPTASSGDAITSGQKAFFDQYTVADFTLTPVRSDASGDLAYDIGTYRFTGVPKAKGDTLKQEGRYVVILHRQSDGTWKALADMDNVSAPPPMPAPPSKKK